MKSEEEKMPEALPEIIPSDEVQQEPAAVETPKPTSPENCSVDQENDPEKMKPPTSIKEMEVHHHTHPGHHKKKWTDYFWEFLMLFLAVFCGFFAEYQLEHKIEADREKQFIESMIEDLQEDHDQLSQYIINLKLGLGQMDSMITILEDKNLIKQHGDQLYYFGRLSPRLAVFNSNTRTFDQLENSGSFRLIRNRAAANRIMTYYSSIDFISHLEGLYFGEFDQYKILASKIFDPSVMRSMELADGNISRQANNPAIRTTDTELLQQMSVFAVYMNGSRRSIIPAAQVLQKNRAGLIEFLKKEYSLENN